MGYFGPSGFDNDEALDWLSAACRGVPGSSIRKALERYLRYVKRGMPRGRAWSSEEIEAFVASCIDRWRPEVRTYPAFQESGLSEEAWLAQRQAEMRDHYHSGRYLDEEYGPVEPAFAAAELVAAWAGFPPDEIPEDIEEAIARARKRPVPAELVDLAIEAVNGILANESYRNMRRFYLSAFPDMSGGDDDMAGVRDTRARLQKAKVV